MAAQLSRESARDIGPSPVARTSRTSGFALNDGWAELARIENGRLANAVLTGTGA
jgi:hypothetical protein